jgi:membrane-bound lytic murein transglycosylase D
MTSRIPGIALALLLVAPACASAAEASSAVLTEAGTRNGREIYENFRQGLADPSCEADASVRWKTHFAHAPKQLASRSDDVLPLFGYVVESLRASSLPTEFALIPFVESGYKPGARSPQGPAGLWQMIAITARNHKVPMRAGYDGRLSPVDSTAAAVRYLKTQHGMFAGDWRLAVMAYNAGEYRVLGSLKRSGQTARNAKPEALVGLSPITQAYVRKLHALSCLLEQADDREEWLHALDRPVPLLQAVTMPEGTTDIAAWARRTGQDAARLQRLNPAFVNGRITRADGKPARLLAVATASQPAESPIASGAVDVPAADSSASLAFAEVVSLPSTPESVASKTTPTAALPSSQPIAERTARHHTVVSGDSPWKIAARYGIRVADLLQRNGLDPKSVLKPGKVLLIDAELVAGSVGQASGTP